MFGLTAGLVISSESLMEEVRSALYNLPVRVQFEQREIGEWAAFLERLERTAPDILLVELDGLPDPLDQVTRQIKATSGSPMVVVVHTSADPEKLLRAIRADADEYVYSPLETDLKRALERLAGERRKRVAGTRPRGRAAGFVSAKGGCGATTVACHTALELHRLTKLDVLLADYDLESGLVGFLMKSQSRYSVLDAADNVHRLDLSFWKALVSNGYPGVEVISAPTDPLVRRQRNMDDFRQMIPFIRSHYDWMMVDLGSSLTPLAVSVLGELDELFVIATLDIPALHQTKQILRSLAEAGFGSEKTRLVMNRMPKRPDVTLDELEKMLGSPIYATIPNDYPGLFEAYASGSLIAPNSNLGKNYSRLAKRMAGLELGAPPKKSLSFLLG